MNKLIALLLIVGTCWVLPTLAENKVVNELQAVSVTVKGCDGSGSGIIITRGDTCYVLTAAHVVDGCRKTRKVIDPEGGTRTIVYFDSVSLIRKLIEGGVAIGKTEVDADVIKYSESGKGDDLALLRVKQKNFTKSSTRFYSADTPPELGAKLWHVGSMGGEDGYNTLSEGIVSQIGRMDDGKEFDVTVAPALKGSSGGGVFLTDGSCIGLVTRGGSDVYSLFVPVRRIREWAERCGVAFILDPALSVPAKLGPIEDSEGGGPAEENPAPTFHWGGGPHG